MSAPRECAWCDGPIPERARRDAATCSQRCRQARHRFGSECVSRRRATAPLRLAYADPPYPKLARRYYAEHPDYAGEVDHRELLSRLQTYDGWALSTSAAALPDVIVMARELGLRPRVASWHRGARGGVSRWPRSAWEPVLYAGGRREPSSEACTDASCGAGVTRRVLASPAEPAEAPPAGPRPELHACDGEHEATERGIARRGVGSKLEARTAAAHEPRRAVTRPEVERERAFAPRAGRGPAETNGAGVVACPVIGTARRVLPPTRPSR